MKKITNVTNVTTMKRKTAQRIRLTRYLNIGLRLESALFGFRSREPYLSPGPLEEWGAVAGAPFAVALLLVRRPPYFRARAGMLQSWYTPW